MRYVVLRHFLWDLCNSRQSVSALALAVRGLGGWLIGSSLLGRVRPGHGWTVTIFPRRAVATVAENTERKQAPRLRYRVHMFLVMTWFL